MMILRGVILALLLASSGAGTQAPAQEPGFPVRPVPDTGQQTHSTSTFGEDADYLINPPAFTLNGDGTVTDRVTGLQWQRADGGEMTAAGAIAYGDTLTLGGYTDWRLPTALELFGILHHDRVNPALDTALFARSAAEYWWSSQRRAGDTARVWVVNAGGGIGPHPMTETISAGGTRRFHVRAVRETGTAESVTTRFRRNADSTVTDLATSLTWQRVAASHAMTWEEALTAAESLVLGGFADWRLPTIKELQSLNDVSRSNPSVDPEAFPGFVTGRYWSSTTQCGAPTRAWEVDFTYGIASYELKIASLFVLCVRGGASAGDTLAEALLPGGEFEMGDHHGFVDPSHPSDELPLHTVRVSSFFIARTETANQLACELLNLAYGQGLVEVRGNCVFPAGRSDTLLYLNGFAPYSSIVFSGGGFSVVDFRGRHPVVGIMWKGAAFLCNVLSLRQGLEPCYDTGTWQCDFAKSGFRLPTEAEWEYAGRGGQYAPYYNYPWGDVQDVTKANWPGSGDPYEAGSLPLTTPVGFYDGGLKQKTEYQWPGVASSYQTGNGANAFGLYDMAGNVWEFVNDWYGNTYYSLSPVDNPKGPDAGFLMPDGKPYRGMRGGNWYNGYSTTGVNDGHSRVSNRNPSYYRGPQDPNHPWYHVGFRFARNGPGTTGLDGEASAAPREYRLFQNYPNPFNPSTVISFTMPAPGRARLVVCDILGREVALLLDGELDSGRHSLRWEAGSFASGIYLCRLSAGGTGRTIKMLLTR